MLSNPQMNEAKGSVGVEMTEKIALASTSSSKKKKSIWTEVTESGLLKELVVLNPFQYRHGSQERGKVWDQVAIALSSLSGGAKACSFTQRTVRDKFKALKTKQRITNNKEKAASGISPEETELEKEIRELVDQLQEMELDGDNIPPQKRDEEEQKKKDGIEMQKVMLERFSETQKRQNDGDSTPQRKRRNNGTEAFSILEKKIQLDQDFRKDEVIRRKEEEERRHREVKEKDRRFELMQQQQIQHQQKMQQQHQQQMQQQHQQQMQHQRFMQQQSQQMQTMMMAVLKTSENKD